MNDKATSNEFFKTLRLLFIGSGVLLLIPLIAMQFTDEVEWQALDFAVMTALLLGSGTVYLAISRGFKNIPRRYPAIAVLLVFCIYGLSCL